METDRDYLNRRACEERDAAERASNPKAKELHLELAARYAEAAQGGGGRPELGIAQAPPHPGLPSDFRILE